VKSFGFHKPSGFGGSHRGGGGAASHDGGLSLTPMIDMFIILIVFLIKGFSTEPAFLTPTQGIELAFTSSDVSAPNSAVLIIGKDGIIIEGKLVVPFKDGVVQSTTLKGGEFPELHKSLKDLADKTKFIAEKNSSVKFTGTLILQADRQLPFETLRPILRTAGLAGYNDIKFAGMQE
jgi:biopolymer transport protein ExbD